MEWILICLLVYLIIISGISVAFCSLDKSRAKNGGRRISEKTLFIVSALGGAMAMFVSMLRIRHKTKHLRFMLGLPAIIIAQFILLLSFLMLHG
ncbi:MAG: DUF1294 domain-containing protein [Clostridia bacterium]|nr:DUF1294 domain-containing protein [Clostridia bacterium]